MKRPKIQGLYKVVSNEKLCPRFYRLCIDAKPILQDIKAGQFIHIKVSDGLEPFFRRPFSVYRAKNHLEILYEVVGPGTQALSLKRPGDDLDLLGHLGQPFRLPEKGIERVVMIAGGIGIAPFLILSDQLARRDYELILLYGGRTSGHVYDMEEFKKNGCTVYISTDDGSVGLNGNVAKLFSKIKAVSASTIVYTCGPHAMMAAVQKFSQQNNLNGQAACEEVMACGLGACLGCSIRTTAGYKTVCYDGPVFDLKEVVF